MIWGEGREGWHLWDGNLFLWLENKNGGCILVIFPTTGMASLLIPFQITTYMLFNVPWNFSNNKMTLLVEVMKNNIPPNFLCCDFDIKFMSHLSNIDKKLINFKPSLAVSLFSVFTFKTSPHWFFQCNKSEGLWLSSI